MFQNTKQKGSVWVAVSIIIAGALVAGAVIFTDKDNTGSNPLVKDQSDQSEQEEVSLDSVPEISDADYYKGNPDATIKIVEYSDPDCPYCKRLHMTYGELLAQYPNDVMWVYRHMSVLSQNSLKQAVAAECAGIQGGNDAFWTMLDRIYEDDNSANSLEKFAIEQGLNVEEFNSCLTNQDIAEKVNNQTEQAYQAGAKGTPFSVVFVPGNERISVPGAQPLNVWQGLVENFISAEAENEEATESGEATENEEINE